MIDTKFTSVYDAVNKGTTVDIIALIKAGADVDARKFGITPLMLAAGEGEFDKIKALLNGGADVLAADAEGHTALAHAMLNGAEEKVLNVLRVAMADVARVAKKADDDDDVMKAAGEAIGEFLEERIGQKKVKLGKTIFRWISKKFTGCDNETMTPSRNPESAASTMISSGITEPVITTSFTNLYRAARKGTVADIRALLEKGANVNEQDRGGGTALMHAAYSNTPEMVRALIDAGAEIDVRDNSGWTALMYAAHSNSLDVIKALLGAGSDVNVKNDSGDTPLMLATGHNTPDIVKALLDAGADPNARTQYDSSILTLAQGRPDSPEKDKIIALLKTAGAKK